MGISSSTGLTSPRLDSIRGRRGDRDGTASKITKQSSLSTYRTQTQQTRPSRTQTQTQTGPKREGDRNCPSCRMHVEIACPFPFPLIHSHYVSEPLIHKPRFSPTLILHTHTHLSLSHYWPAPPLLPLHRSVALVSGQYHIGIARWRDSRSHPHFHFYSHSHRRPPLRLTCQPPWRRRRAICRAKLRFSCSPSDQLACSALPSGQQQPPP